MTYGDLALCQVFRVDKPFRLLDRPEDVVTKLLQYVPVEIRCGARGASKKMEAVSHTCVYILFVTLFLVVMQRIAEATSKSLCAFL